MSRIGGRRLRPFIQYKEVCDRNWWKETETVSSRKCVTVMEPIPSCATEDWQERQN